MVRILTLNIGAAAEPRALRQLEWLAAREEDVLVLTETSSGPGTKLLLDRFTGAGWDVLHRPLPGERGAAIVSRVPLAESPAFAGVSIPYRAVHGLLETSPRIGVLGLYVPNAKGPKKTEFIDSLLDALRSLPAEQRDHLVVAGDYNVIGRDHHPAHPGFHPYEHRLLEELADLGLADAHALRHPGVQEHSWVGRTGEGYRYDYAHVGAALHEQMTVCSYLHETRTGPDAITDHSAVTVEFTIAARRLEVGDPRDGGELTLF